VLWRGDTGDPLLSGLRGGRPGPLFTTTGSLIAEEADFGEDEVEDTTFPGDPWPLIMVGEADFDFVRAINVETVVDTRAKGLRGGRPGPRFKGITDGNEGLLATCL